MIVVDEEIIDRAWAVDVVTCSSKTYPNCRSPLTWTDGSILKQDNSVKDYLGLSLSVRLTKTGTLYLTFFESMRMTEG